MQRHTKIYLQAAGIKPGEYITCEWCGCPATDIHHIQRRGMGGSKTADRPENLMALCRSCHERMGDKVEYKDSLRDRHQEVMSTWMQTDKRVVRLSHQNAAQGDAMPSCRVSGRF